MNTDMPEELIPALRQYRHNFDDGSGSQLLTGFDYDETIKAWNTRTDTITPAPVTEDINNYLRGALKAYRKTAVHPYTAMDAAPLVEAIESVIEAAEAVYKVLITSESSIFRKFPTKKLPDTGITTTGSQNDE